MTTNDLKQLSEHTFANHYPVLNLFQTLADHFYPERADFTFTRNVGEELADSLVDSYPILVRRDLANSFSAMLRDGDWFDVTTQDDPTHSAQMWLQYAGQRLRRLMNHREANFTRATKEGDHDYATFGQCVISIERNRKADGLLYRCWHLRDCAWWDDESGSVGGVIRKWMPAKRHLLDYFGEKALHKECMKDIHTKPFDQVDVRHFVIPTRMYGDDQLESRFPFVSVYLDMKHDHILEETGLNHRHYVVPRFQTISGSPYAYSPATVVGLPDARALQAMTHTLLEAGERYARPPIIATQKAIRGDVDLASDGITWVDDEYDERMGASLRPLMQDRGGFPIGAEMRENVVDVLSSAFYLNKLSLPETSREMTAYEVSERMKQFRRENLPLFAPIEADYNGQLCELSFDIAMNNGFLGSPYDIPQELRDQDVEFKFQSPLSQSEEEEKVTRFQQVSQMLAEAAQHDQAVTGNVNFDVAVRDAIVGMGAPAQWLNSIEQVLQGREMRAMAEVAAMTTQTGMVDAPT